MRRIQCGGFGTCLFSGGLFRFGLPPDAPQKKDEERIKVIESGWEPPLSGTFFKEPWPCLEVLKRRYSWRQINEPVFCNHEKTSRSFRAGTFKQAALYSLALGGSAEDIDFRGGSSAAVQRICSGKAEVTHGLVNILEVDVLLDRIGARLENSPSAAFFQVLPSALTSNWYLSVMPSVFPS